MEYEGASTKFHLVCSDQPRNGKTDHAAFLDTDA